ncbi:DUF4236 domain-containing protein [Fictibacillus sp. KIGAM418]|uniref:DUF4236 domain-containing protein n=1 Tax=Fictibacillus marinisediminis TaxID=2878389 RepID=A0A9X1XEN7_9BACL|nr:DUF4236 domain-containing protein [Fictibacillus marinisediminis]MCK6259537.1 DUF4236 domain-containing protein [Fictibacillus marinisediminis]
MRFGFRKSFKIALGVRLNVSKSGVGGKVIHQLDFVKTYPL